MLVPSCILLICGGKCLIVRSKQIWDKEASLSPGPASRPRSDLRPALVTIITSHSPARPLRDNNCGEHGYKYNLLIWHFLIIWSVYCEDTVNLYCGRIFGRGDFDKCWQENKAHWERPSVIRRPARPSHLLKTISAVCTASAQGLLIPDS